MRLDVIVSIKYQISRNKAQTYISEGLVSVNGKTSLKASLDLSGDEEIILEEKESDYVGRGGYKLEKAIKAFNLNFGGKTIVDIGASTGGFTDCALKNGASRAYTFDVGTDQLDQTLRLDPRVISKEGINFKDVPKIPDFIDFFVMDVSFVSVLEMAESIKIQANLDSLLVMLIKPQFEVGKGNTKKGIVYDQKSHLAVLNKVIDGYHEFGFNIMALTHSPIKGKNGNIEYLALFSLKNEPKSIDYKRIVANAFSDL